MKTRKITQFTSKGFYSVFVFACIAFAISSFKKKPAANNETVGIAKEAYTFGLPIILTDLTRIGSGKPNNSFQHIKLFPDHTFRWVVRPNNDTYYSTSFLDLGTEPIVLSIPDTKDRYDVIPLMDAYTNIFASFGKRTTGTKAQQYIITSPKFTGKLPAGIKEVKSPTDLVWVIGRIQVNSPADGKDFVAPLQDGLTLTPLSKWNKNVKAVSTSITANSYSIESSPTIQDLKSKKLNVVEALKKLTTEEYFNYLNELLARNPGSQEDKAALERFAKIGVRAGAKFNIASFDSETQAELNKVPEQIINFLSAAKTIVSSKAETKPDLTIGHYGTNYIKRAAVAYFGLGALGPEEAVYQNYLTDQNNQSLNGDNKYVIHFEKGKTPPAKAFWSITLYDKDGYLTENSIRRYAIGDRDNLKYNADGSLDIYIQHENPTKEKESNWLPAPKENFNLTTRIYWPTDEFLHTGNWTKPPISKIE